MIIYTKQILSFSLVVLTLFLCALNVSAQNIGFVAIPIPIIQGSRLSSALNYVQLTQSSIKIITASNLVPFEIIPLMIPRPETMAGIPISPLLNRTEAAKELIKLEMEIASRVADELRSQVQRITPFKWDSKEDIRLKKQLVQETEKEIKRWEQEAIEEAKSGENWVENDSGKLELEEGPAMKQLRKISTTGWGGN